jgi:hypothetical protein
MSAPNFYAVCGKYFVLSPIEGEEESMDIEYDFNEVIESILNDLKKYYIIQEDKWDNERGYEGRIFARIVKEWSYNNKRNDDYREFRIDIDLILRNGYFEGCNLDYDIHYYYDGIECEEEFWEYIDKRTYNYVMKWLDKVKKDIEASYQKYSIQYELLGVFSNSEAIYTRKGVEK